MMSFHYIELTTYCHATEDPGRVKEALLNAAGSETEIEEKTVRGHYGNTITIMQSKIEKRAEFRSMFDQFPKELIGSLIETLEKRVDENCNFYFRLDKASAYLEEPKLSDGNYVIKVRAKIESYPVKREKAVNNTRQFLSNFIKE